MRLNALQYTASKTQWIASLDNDKQSSVRVVDVKGACTTQLDYAKPRDSGRPHYSHSMVNWFEFALLLLGFLAARRTHTNCDTIGGKAPRSPILYGGPSQHKRASIVNKLRENLGKHPAWTNQLHKHFNHS